MLDKEQQLTEAAMRYLALIEGDRIVSIADYVASVDPMLREELGPYLEQTLAIGEPEAPIILSMEEQAMAARVTERVISRSKAQLRASRPQTLTEMLAMRKMTMGALANKLNLPVVLLAKIMRGGVRLETIRDRFFERIADAIGQAEADIRAALALAQPARSATQLSASDGTVLPAEEVVSFAEALEASGATADQRAEWASE